MPVINFLCLNATAGLFQTIYLVLLWKALAMNHSLQPCYKSYNIASKGKKCVSPPKILSPCPLCLGLFTFLLSLGQLMLVKWKCKLLCLHRTSCKVVQLNTCACVYYLVFLTVKNQQPELPRWTGHFSWRCVCVCVYICFVSLNVMWIEKPFIWF